jgi:hypothetical protein
LMRAGMPRESIQLSLPCASSYQSDATTANDGSLL